MKNTWKLFAIGAFGVALAGCVVDSGGGVVAPTTPAPLPEPIYQTKWIGTAPLCAAKPGHCANLGPGWEFVQENAIGDGSPCATGRKVQCRKQIN